MDGRHRRGEKGYYYTVDTLVFKLCTCISVSAEEPKRDSGAIEKYFSEALPIIDAGQQKVRTDQVYFAVVAILCFILLVFSSDITPPWGLGMPLAFVRVILTIIIGYLFWMGIVLSNFELNGLLATRKDINNILRVNPHC